MQLKIPPQVGGSEPKNLNSLGASSTEPLMGYPLLETERAPSKIICGFFISEFCGFPPFSRQKFYNIHLSENMKINFIQ
jgi:hypothetical protein